jgi:acetyltransferase-like isoleucine patch superfamily enzyme
VFFQPILSSWHKQKLRWQARVYGGRLRIGTDVRIVHPTRFQGRGHLTIEDGVSLGFSLAGALKSPILLQPREADAKIVLGKNCAVMNGCELMARTSIEIGSRVLLGPGTLVIDADYHQIAPALRHEPGKTAPVRIERNVWVGARAIILKGVVVGEDAVIAAGCVVSKDVSPRTVVAGNPMRVVGTTDGA